MMRFSFKKRCAVYAACMIVSFVCTVFSLNVQAAEENGLSQTASAKLYDSMSDNSGVIANLIVGNVFEVIGSENDDSGGTWYRVVTDFGAEGYVKAAELDRLIMEAQAMQQGIENNVGAEPPVGNDENAGEAGVPDDGAEPNNEEGNVDGAGNANEAEPDRGEANADRAEQNNVPTNDNANNSGAEQNNVPASSANNAEADQNNMSANNNNNNNAGEAEPEDGQADNADDGEAEPNGMDAENNNEEESNSMPSSSAADNTDVSDMTDDAAGFGGVSDPKADEDSNSAGGFTIIEKTNTSKIHRQGKIDAVLIIVIAGGILCIIAITFLVKRVLTCLRMER